MNSDSHQSKQALTPESEPPDIPPASSSKVIVDVFGTVIWLLSVFGYVLRAIFWLLSVFGYVLRAIFWLFMMFVFVPSLAGGLGWLIGEKIGGDEAANIGAIIGVVVMLSIMIFFLLSWIARHGGFRECFKTSWKGWES